jgi:glycosyltransferase involved in cell wall biosynthesis
MKIAFLHYHARRGGITRVIAQQIDALSGEAGCLFISGNGTDPETGVSPVVVPGAGYDGQRSGEPPEKVAEDILSAIETKWPSGCDVLHIHNPILKKNSDFLKIVHHLARRGVRLFLQIHDTAEDLRPQSYYFGEEYPENCHYGVINSRDYTLFLAAGLKKEGLHRIFNVVQPLPVFPPPSGSQKKDSGEERKIFLYAVRAIRRKNLGEALLLSCFLPEEHYVGFTLPPTSPQDYPPYEEWKAFVFREGIAAAFEMGLQSPLSHLVGRSALMLTTSIREGFGFSFLEPWTAGRAVMGRRLSAVAPDFVAAGVDLAALYERIAVPLDLVDTQRMKTLWLNTVQAVCAQYGRETPFDAPAAWEKLTQDGLIDFAFLDAEAARSLISRCRASSDVRRVLAQKNPCLDSLCEAAHDIALIEKNRRVIAENFSKEKYRAALLDIYGKILKNKVSHRIDKRKLLDSFLRPENFLLGGM